MLEMRKLKKGDRVEAKKMIMVITGESEKAYLGYFEYKGRAVGQCSLEKALLDNPHFENNYTILD
jgi:hypothetical protein